MIFEFLCSAVFGILKILFSIIPDLPSLPDFVGSSIEGLFDLVFDNVQLLGFFISIDMIKILVPLIILVENFDHIYHFIIWLIKKIPISTE